MQNIPGTWPNVVAMPICLTHYKLMENAEALYRNFNDGRVCNVI